MKLSLAPAVQLKPFAYGNGKQTLDMNISGTGSLAALAGYQTGEAPLEVRVALLKASQEQMEAQSKQLIEVVESAGQSSASNNELDTYA